jgi:hypothetical protein
MAVPGRPSRRVVALTLVASLDAACGGMRSVAHRDARTDDLASVPGASDAVVASDDETPRGDSTDLGSIAAHTPTDSVEVVADGTAVITGVSSNGGTEAAAGTGTDASPSTGLSTGTGTGSGSGSGTGTSTPACATAQAGDDAARALTLANNLSIESTLAADAASYEDGVIEFFPTVDTEVEFKTWLARSLQLADGRPFPYQDGWCRPYGSFTADPATFTLSFTSAGEDGTFGTTDDIEATWTGR